MPSALREEMENLAGDDVQEMSPGEGADGWGSADAELPEFLDDPRVLADLKPFFETLNSAPPVIRQDIDAPQVQVMIAIRRVIGDRLHAHGNPLLDLSRITYDAITHQRQHLRVTGRRAGLSFHLIRVHVRLLAGSV